MIRWASSIWPWAIALVVQALDELPELAHPLQGVGAAEPLDRRGFRRDLPFRRGDECAGPPEHEQRVVARR